MRSLTRHALRLITHWSRSLIAISREADPFLALVECPVA